MPYMYFALQLAAKRKTVRANADPTWPHFSASVIKIAFAPEPHGTESFLRCVRECKYSFIKFKCSSL